MSKVLNVICAHFPLLVFLDVCVWARARACQLKVLLDLEKAVIRVNKDKSRAASLPGRYSDNKLTSILSSI